MLLTASPDDNSKYSRFAHTQISQILSIIEKDTRQRAALKFRICGLIVGYEKLFRWWAFCPEKETPFSLGRGKKATHTLQTGRVESRQKCYNRNVSEMEDMIDGLRNYDRE